MSYLTCPFEISVSIGANDRRISVLFSNGLDGSRFSTKVEVDKDNLCIVHQVSWWRGIDKYNIGQKVLDIISRSIAEFLSIDEEDEERYTPEFDLDEYIPQWESEINNYLDSIRKKETKKP